MSRSRTSTLDPDLVFECQNLMGSFQDVVMTPRLFPHTIFIWGRAAGDWEKLSDLDPGVLQWAALAWQISAPPITIPGYIGAERGQGDYGYPGPHVWEAYLHQISSIPSRFILRTAGKGINTKTEMEDCLTLARRKRLACVIGVTTVMHALRAMLGAVKALEARGLLDAVDVLPFWSYLFDFDREVYGSQGEGPYLRTHWLGLEFDRIPRYQAQGDLVSLRQLLTYLKRVRRKYNAPDPAGVDERLWHELCRYYHWPEKDRPLLDGILPVGST